MIMSAQHTLPDDMRRRGFRDVMRQYPTGVCAITARDDNAHIVMVVGSFTSVSLEPMLVGFLADRGSSSYARLRETGAFVVNLLASDQTPLCRQMSSGEMSGRWDGISFTETAAGIRRLAGAVGWLECTRVAIQPAGDHDFVLGQVDAFASGATGDALLFAQGGFGRFATQERP